jgi:hypothetical protein
VLARTASSTRGIRELKAVSVNVASHKHILMSILASEVLIDLLLVQEIPWVQIGKSGKWGTVADRNFLCLMPVSVPSERNRLRVVIYLQRSLIQALDMKIKNQYDLIEDLNMMAVQIKFRQLRYEIWNMYIPPLVSKERKGEDVLEELLTPAWPQEAIICGDMNCTSALWGDRMSRPAIASPIEDRIIEEDFSVITLWNAAT